MKLNSVSFSPYSMSGSANFFDADSRASISICFTDAQCTKIAALIQSFLPAICDKAIEALGDAKTDMLCLEAPKENNDGTHF